MCQNLVEAKVKFVEAKPFVFAFTKNEQWRTTGVARVGRGDSYSIQRGKEVAKGRALKALTLANQGKRISQRDMMKMGYSRVQEKVQENV